MSLPTTPYKGARDFYPEDKRIQKHIFGVWRKTAESFGYEEYDASIIEPIELYQAKTSQEIVNEQTYTFEDRGGRKVTLRPEMTPSVSRMVAARRQELAYPLRWYSIPNVWRYERPQRGRLREHWQLNVDIFGVADASAEHEIILLADGIMQAFGAPRDTYTIRLNSRQLINYLLSEYLKLPDESVMLVIRLIDKLNKLSKDTFTSQLKELVGPKATEIAGWLEHGGLAVLPSELKDHASVKRLHNLQMHLAKAGITNTQFDLSLMRGFDYYTDIVFEIFDTNPDNGRSLFGGGRYDGLVGAFGVEPLPTVGFGVGDVTMRDFLETHNLLPELSSTTDLRVILVGDTYLAAQTLLTDLRTAGVNVSVDASDKKIDKKIKAADKSGARFVLFVGEAELAKGEFNLKELATGQEQQVTVRALIELLQSS